MTEPICQLFYISTISRTLTMRDIEAILDASRTNNLRDGITGLLVRVGGASCRCSKEMAGRSTARSRAFATTRGIVPSSSCA
ncbi:BLUF domain-containing protein [Sphingomicrobium sp. B8]|uniref:BLUF domain-containing protein n=1 Tax=Sphingomicrobium clamense TaxID=2851013 RepID=A0ABS6V6S0_9SPHN|nr:BLUF domain-containing protein [Sphingomicrobium sp. B8]